MIRLLTLFTFVAAALASAAESSPREAERAQELKELIAKEKPAFAQRENQRRDLLEELDHLNSDQNHIRERLGVINQSLQELTMALENLSLEYKKQKELETYEKKRLVLLFKVVYRVKRDGILRTLVYGDKDLPLASRLRVLYRAVKSHASLTKQLEERGRRLVESEAKITRERSQSASLATELSEHETLLKGLLERKQAMLKTLKQKQGYYQAMVKEYKHISAQLSALFHNFESERGSQAEAKSFFPKRGTLPPPVDLGRILTSFGKEVNQKFGTVTFHKGIEIEAEQNTPVRAVLSGTVEFGGWVKGMGNVLILHHGGGFYTLSAHLFKALKERGAKVEQGETIGLVGDTGSSEKPSLYFEIRERSRAIDPMLYLARRTTNSTLN